MAAHIRDPAQVQGELLDVPLDKVCQPGPVCTEVGGGEMLHHVVVEHVGPVVEGPAESIHADARHVKLCGFPGGSP